MDSESIIFSFSSQFICSSQLSSSSQFSFSPQFNFWHKFQVTAYLPIIRPDNRRSKRAAKPSFCMVVDVNLGRTQICARSSMPIGGDPKFVHGRRCQYAAKPIIRPDNRRSERAAKPNFCMVVDVNVGRTQICAWSSMSMCGEPKFLHGRRCQYAAKPIIHPDNRRPKRAAKPNLWMVGGVNMGRTQICAWSSMPICGEPKFLHGRRCQCVAKPIICPDNLLNLKWRISICSDDRVTLVSGVV